MYFNDEKFWIGFWSNISSLPRLLLERIRGLGIKQLANMWLKFKDTVKLGYNEQIDLVGSSQFKEGFTRL